MVHVFMKKSIPGGQKAYLHSYLNSITYPRQATPTEPNSLVAHTKVVKLFQWLKNKPDFVTVLTLCHSVNTETWLRIITKV